MDDRSDPYTHIAQEGGFLRYFTNPFGGQVCHQDTINAIEYSPDGRRLASASSDGTISIWDSSAGRQVLSQKRLEGLVTT